MRGWGWGAKPLWLLRIRNSQEDVCFLLSSVLQLSPLSLILHLIFCACLLPPGRAGGGSWSPSSLLVGGSLIFLGLGGPSDAGQVGSMDFPLPLLPVNFRNLSCHGNGSVGFSWFSLDSGISWSAL